MGALHSLLENPYKILYSFLPLRKRTHRKTFSGGISTAAQMRSTALKRLVLFSNFSSRKIVAHDLRRRLSPRILNSAAERFRLSCPSSCILSQDFATFRKVKRKVAWYYHCSMFANLHPVCAHERLHNDGAYEIIRLAVFSSIYRILLDNTLTH